MKNEHPQRKQKNTKNAFIFILYIDVAHENKGRKSNLLASENIGTSIRLLGTAGPERVDTEIFRYIIHFVTRFI